MTTASALMAGSATATARRVQVPSAERHAYVVGSTLGALDGPSAGGLDAYVLKLAP